MDIINGKIAFTSFCMDTPDTDIPVNRQVPNGGVTNPIQTAVHITIPNCSVLIPSCWITGRNIGIVIRRIGVVGTGAIGMNVARIAAAFGCEVLAYSRTKKEMDNVRYVSLDELMAESDIISLHVPSNAETKGLISAEKIALMKPNAVLINTARGPVLDSQALADALNNDKIAGACIDVFETEPPIAKTHPLVNAKHTILTPHVAFASKEAMVKRAIIVFDNVVKYLNGTPQNIM